LHVQAAALASARGDPHSPWQGQDGWRVSGSSEGVALVFGDGDARHPVRVRPGADGNLELVLPSRTAPVSASIAEGRVALTLDGGRIVGRVVPLGEDRMVFAPGLRRRLALLDPLAHAGEEEEHAGHLMAPMSGTVVAVLVKPGESVAKGAALIVLEAMKMEHTIVAPAPGIVEAVNFGVGDRVAEGEDLVDLRDA